MCKDKEGTKGEDNMDVAMKRPCSPNKSLEKSIKEMKLIRKGKLPKKTWNDLKTELEKEKK